MRVISQDRTINCPYETTTFTISEFISGVVILANINGHLEGIGEYETFAEAKVALENMTMAAITRCDTNDIYYLD